MNLQTFSTELGALALPPERMARANEVARELGDADRSEFLARLRELAVKAPDTAPQGDGLIALENANTAAEKMLKRQERVQAEQEGEDRGELGQVEQKILELPS